MKPNWPLLIVAVVVTALISSGLSIGVMALHELSGQRPPVLRDLGGGTWEDGNRVFQQRVLAAAPVGAPEEQLVQFLRGQTFHPSWDPPKGAEKTADLSWTEFPCGILASVTWRTNAAGRITDLTTYYHEIGCL